MKFYASLFCLFLILVSCKNEESNQNEELNSKTEKSVNNNIPEVEPKRSNAEGISSTSDENGSESTDGNSENNTEVSEANISGNTYIKIDESDANCNCYCLELDMNKSTELCLSENEIYINARYAQAGDDVNMYYASPSNKNTNEDLPWKEFDTNTPIAVLSAGKNGNMVLDWKGFSIDGELAVDYAIYGKKTLEGTYKKQ
ncbi:hypothetical protein [Salegentibacter salarius]|uniref:Lipoprotein n=1 Tax=Salegentibacter salarius TaxID=435906 RepID=A0A2N0TXF0_9FLAO|nr:hypothetical protein [Salegentibacter salarius]OEY73118.1 hypothetical protein BHS39_10960 [Salegentibacter salarius]PKD19401.1 hypothetical protein APR40_10940 [Salegentibacter salarius]SLJ99552.1 hypothetical protein SAMN05660445_02235 [Salegentibacter salarius]